MRIFIIVAICIVLGCVGLFFYLEYNEQKFAASLPKLPIENITKETSKPAPQSNKMEPPPHDTR